MLNDEFDEVKKETLPSNPKYNIEKTSFNTYDIVMSVPGFTRQDIDISFKDGVLIIKGILNNAHKKNTNYLHRGLELYSFENSFSLSSKLEVVVASLKDGLLAVSLKDKTAEQEEEIITPL